jgi:hypothetical protein
MMALVDWSTVDIIVMSSLTPYILKLCALNGAINRKHHTMYPCVTQFMKISKEAANRLRLLHLHERGEIKPIALDAYVAEWRKTQGMPNSVPESPSKPMSDTQAQDSATKKGKARPKKSPPKGKPEGRGGGVVTPPPSIDSSNSPIDPNQNLPGDPK